MIIRHDVTAETYAPLQFTNEALRGVQEAFRDHAPPDVELDLDYTDTGEPFLIVGEPGAGLDDAIITRGEHGWQMHRGENGPLYQFASAREAAEFVGAGMIRPRW